MMFSGCLFFNDDLTVTGIMIFFSLPTRTQAVNYMCTEYKALLNQNRKRVTPQL